MNKKLPTPRPNLASPVSHDKWDVLREASRITLADHKSIPYCNSTTTGLYLGHELTHRGRTPCSHQ